MFSCTENLFKSIRNLFSSTKDETTGGDENLRDETTGDGGGQPLQGKIMVAPPAVVADPIFEMQFPQHVIQFTADVVLTTIGDQQPIGEGTTAKVYRGLLGGRDTAIKCIDNEFASQFEDELKAAVRCNHPRIIKCIGYCTEQRAIVYDFMRGGSLDTLISRQGQYASHPPLAWKKRLEIALGILDGIRYLQEEIEGEMAIVHVDLKPENILLDESLNPYIADFGACVTIKKGNIDATTEEKKFLGTVGYMDVAIHNQGSVSFGTDIFSFGSILLDLFMGRNLYPKIMDRIITPDYVTQIMDPNLKIEKIPMDEAMEVVLLVSRCRMFQTESRPRLEEVIHSLTTIKNRY